MVGGLGDEPDVRRCCTGVMRQRTTCRTLLMTVTRA